ncbi:hypothetical protein BZG36_00911 [Bifiguratus adelaidae]|uniref:Uncharacterized protein n=1 Tax=Bifiguratus adelaidae TaxID=1938954 RepID=A0A261Y5X8_9FUNG|nr:hypothetical protein BZG36_00911 [Bifiguratus adelaidae]
METKKGKKLFGFKKRSEDAFAGVDRVEQARELERLRQVKEDEDLARQIQLIENEGETPRPPARSPPPTTDATPQLPPKPIPYHPVYLPANETGLHALVGASKPPQQEPARSAANRPPLTINTKSSPTKSSYHPLPPSPVNAHSQRYSLPSPSTPQAQNSHPPRLPIASPTTTLAQSSQSLPTITRMPEPALPIQMPEPYDGHPPPPPKRSSVSTFPFPQTAPNMYPPTNYDHEVNGPQSSQAFYGQGHMYAQSDGALVGMQKPNMDQEVSPVYAHPPFSMVHPVMGKEQTTEYPDDMHRPIYGRDSSSVESYSGAHGGGVVDVGDLSDPFSDEWQARDHDHSPGQESVRASKHVYQDQQPGSLNRSSSTLLSPEVLLQAKERLHRLQNPVSPAPSSAVIQAEGAVDYSGPPVPPHRRFVSEESDDYDEPVDHYAAHAQPSPLVNADISQDFHNMSLQSPAHEPRHGYQVHEETAVHQAFPSSYPSADPSFGPSPQSPYNQPQHSQMAAHQTAPTPQPQNVYPPPPKVIEVYPPLDMPTSPPPAPPPPPVHTHQMTDGLPYRGAQTPAIGEHGIMYPPTPLPFSRPQTAPAFGQQNGAINHPSATPSATDKSNGQLPPTLSEDKHIIVTSANDDGDVWIKVDPKDTGKTLAHRIYTIATFRTRKVVAMFDEKGRPVPIDKNVPLFKNWTDLANFKDGQRWRVLYGDGPEKSVVEKLFDVVDKEYQKTKRRQSTLPAGEVAEQKEA